MNLFTYVKQQVSIVDLVSSYTTLKKIGGYYKGLCPFHHEKTPSFTVSPHKEIFYCFGCHESGDVIAFIELIERCAALQAVLFLIERYALDIPKEYFDKEKIASANFDEQRHYWKLMEVVARWCHEQLLSAECIQAYILERRIDQVSMQKFLLGYFPGSQQKLEELVRIIQHHNFLLADLIQAGIVAKNQYGLYSGFQNRILFPIRDQVGRVCAFGGRIVQADDDRAKYYNSKENAHFHKGMTLYNLDRAKKSMQEKGAVFLVEGYFDCIALVQHGYENTLATLGTACTVEHLQTINRYVSTIYVLYDADSAGMQAVLKLARLCWQVNIDIQIVQLPSKDDPASFLARDGDLKMYLDQSMDIFLFFIKSQRNNGLAVDLRASIDALSEVFDVIKTIDNPLKQEFLLQAGAKSLNVNFHDFKREFTKIAKKESRKRVAEQVTGPPQEKLLSLSTQLDRLSSIEKKLFSVIINNVYKFPEDQIYLIEFFSPPLKNIVRQLQSALQRNEAFVFNEFYAELSEVEKRIVSSLGVLFSEHEREMSEITLLIQTLRKNAWRKTMSGLKEKLIEAQTKGNTQEVHKILSEFQELKHGFGKSNG